MRSTPRDHLIAAGDPGPFGPAAGAGSRTFSVMGRRLAVLCTLLLTACSPTAGHRAASPPSDDSGIPSSSASATPTVAPFVPGTTVTDSLAGQGVRLDFPLTGGMVGLAIYFHGAGAQVDSKMGEAWLNGIRARGWAVASGDLHGDAWGSPPAVADAVALAAWARARTGLRAKLLIGASMGGVASLNAILDRALQPTCWFGPQPVVDLNAVSLVPNADAQIAQLYGGRPPASSNPADRLDQLPTWIRYRVIISREDTWVPPAAHADRLIAVLLAKGADVSSVTVSGSHLDASHFRPEDLVAFADGCV
jgi:hypothetical protein